MDPYLLGLSSGILPVVVLGIVYICVLSGRLAKIETDISWLIKELRGSQLRSKDRIV